MTSRTLKVSYWMLTLLFAVAMFLSGLMGLIRPDQSQEVMDHLQYPLYMLTILGVAKMAGAIAIIQSKFKTLKEWAYAGFTIDIVGASASMLLVGDPIATVLSPLIFLAVMFASYGLWKKIEVVN